jgi:hypothetical protein
MSHYVEECYSVYHEKTVRARIEHICDACTEKISKGHRYARIAIIFEKVAETIKRCLRCQTIHLHIRNLDPGGDSWPDEKLACGNSYFDHWGVDPPEEIQELAFITPEEAQKVCDLWVRTK